MSAGDDALLGRGDATSLRVAARPWFPGATTAALAVVVAVAAVAGGAVGTDFHFIQNDEHSNISQGRAIAEDLWFLFDADPGGRGLERLPGWIYAIPAAVAGNVPDELRIGHALFALLYGLVAVPAFALGRALGLGRGPAVAAAALAVATPWAVYSATLLNTTPAVFATTLAVLAIWRATIAPSWRADTLALAAIALVSLARVSHGILGVIFVLAVVIDALRWPRRRVGFRARLAGTPRRVVSEHPVLFGGGAVIAMAVLAAGGPDVLTGSVYESSPDFTLNRVFDRVELATAQLAQNGAIIALIIALGWLLHQLARPSGRELAAFASIALATGLVLAVLSSLSTPEERYIAPVWPLISIAFVLALARREVSVVGVVLAGAVIWRAVVGEGLKPLAFTPEWGWFTAPAGNLFVSDVLAWVGRNVSLLGMHPGTLICAMAAVVCVATAVALRRDGAWTTGALWAPVLVVLVVSAVGGGVALSRFHSGPGMPALSFEKQAFVDNAVGSQRVAYYAPDGWWKDSAAVNTFAELTGFNRSVNGTLESVEGGRYRCCDPAAPAEPLTVDAASGRVRWMAAATRPYVLVPDGFHAIGFLGATVASSSYPYPARVVRLSRPLTATYAVRGADHDGWGQSGRSLVVRVFGPAGRGDCLRGGVLAAPVLERPLRVRIGGRGLSLGAGEGKRFRRRIGATRPRDVPVEVAGAGKLHDGRAATVKVQGLTVGRC